MAGTIAPGNNSIGALILGNTILSGSYACEINGANADSLGTGTLNITGATLNFSIISLPTALSYTIATYAGTLTGTFNVLNRPSGYSVDYSSAGQINLVRDSYSMWRDGLTWPLGADKTPTGDPDRDGLNNAIEYVAGLNPTSALSRFDVNVQEVPGQPGQMAIVFGPIIAGRTYVVKSKSTLADLQWIPLVSFSTSDNGAIRTVTDLAASTGLKFYIVEITLP